MRGAPVLATANGPGGLNGDFARCGDCSVGASASRTRFVLDIILGCDVLPRGSIRSSPGREARMSIDPRYLLSSDTSLLIDRDNPGVIVVRATGFGTKCWPCPVACTGFRAVVRLINPLVNCVLRTENLVESSVPNLTLPLRVDISRGTGSCIAAFNSGAPESFQLSIAVTSQDVAGPQF
jgi:hypothetical protein